MASSNIWINDFTVLKQLYVNNKILDRPPLQPRPVNLFSQINGKQWQKRRKYASSTVLSITNTSFILSHVKQCIDNYIEPLLNEHQITQHKLWYPTDYLHYLAFNNIWSAIFNKTLPYNDPAMLEYCDTADKVLRASGIAILFDLTTNFI